MIKCNITSCEHCFNESCRSESLEVKQSGYTGINITCPYTEKQKEAYKAAMESMRGVGLAEASYVTMGHTHNTTAPAIAFDDFVPSFVHTPAFTQTEPDPHPVDATQEEPPVQQTAEPIVTQEVTWSNMTAFPLPHLRGRRSR